MKTFNQNSHSGDYKASEISVSITVAGGTYGGGSEVLIVDVLPFDTTQVTSKDNYSHPKWGGLPSTHKRGNSPNSSDKGR